MRADYGKIFRKPDSDTHFSFNLVFEKGTLVTFMLRKKSCDGYHARSGLVPSISHQLESD